MPATGTNDQVQALGNASGRYQAFAINTPLADGEQVGFIERGTARRPCTTQGRGRDCARQDIDIGCFCS